VVTWTRENHAVYRCRGGGKGRRAWIEKPYDISFETAPDFEKQRPRARGEDEGADGT